MPYDYSKLRGKITEKYGTQMALAKKIGWSERTLSLKLNGKIAFSQKDIEDLVEVLGIERQDIQKYFFAVCVQ
ncbi:MAG: DUF739 family protein [Anaerotignum sp.]|nr:DUF739 family protein [Lachnospiraceae bacterium]MBR6541731.1 DUF739 family protein [Anaerotignum sp.]